MWGPSKLADEQDRPPIGFHRWAALSCLLAGPNVATILALRLRFRSVLLLVDQNGPEIVDVG